jgi:nucleoside-diphosphate kinase
MLKSHIVADYRLAAAVISRVLGTGLAIMALSQIVLSNQQIAALYQEHEAQPYYLGLARSVSGPVMPMALRGVNAIHRWRTLLGATNSMVALPGTLRAEFGSRQKVADNVAHGSDSVAAARRELALFFPADLRLFP